MADCTLADKFGVKILASYLKRDLVHRGASKVKIGRDQSLPLCFYNNLDFLNEFRFKLHGTNAINFTVDIMISVNQTYVFDFSAHFNHQ